MKDHPVIRSKTHQRRCIVLMPYNSRRNVAVKTVSISLPHVTFIDGPYQEPAREKPAS